MPTRGHRGGTTRTHTRTNSGGASKLALNLQFTQKDAPPPRLPDKSRKNAQFNHEPAARTTASFSRTSSSHHIASREHIQPVQPRRAPTPLTSTRTNANSRQKVDFRISSPSEGDDDEWISSESGAATPNTRSADSDAEEPTTPVEPVKSLIATSASHFNGFHRSEDVDTPKAEAPPPLPPTDEVHHPEPPSPATTARDYAHQHTPLERQLYESQLDDRRDQRYTQAEQPSSQQLPAIARSRSETHSPPRTSPPPKRQSMTRPPSTHSVTSRSDAVTLRPHPLIRGHSYGHPGAFAAMPAPLAPLTMVSSDAAQAQMSNASSPTSLRASSPSSIRTASASPNSSSPSSSQAHRQLRRTSTSSVRSTATVPVQTSASQAQLSKASHDRQRTLSAISSSSSFAALSNLALRSTPSPPRTPVHITSRFPPPEQSANLEAIHPLLPPPYLNAHVTVLTYRNPIAQSYDRVIRAKPSR